MEVMLIIIVVVVVVVMLSLSNPTPWGPPPSATAYLFAKRACPRPKRTLRGTN